MADEECWKELAQRCPACYGTQRAVLIVKRTGMNSLREANPGEAMRGAKGFSLIEMLIVVAIILIITAIAVPSFLRSRMAANESAAAESIRTLNTAMISYNSSYPTVGYAASLTNLGPGGITAACPAPPTSTASCLIDGQLASGSKSGYTFTVANVTGTPNSTYNVIASPSSSTSGARYFCSFADAAVRVSMTTITTCDGTIAVQQ